MSKLIVINCVGLTPRHIGPDTPRLKTLADSGFCAPLHGVTPAVTTTAQTTMLTGVLPQEHGIVGNGWYFRDLGEVLLWRQSEKLVQAPLLWETQNITTLKYFWWYAMNSSADSFVTPRPAYHADGAKSPDFYSHPATLKKIVQEKHGPFPLFQFWGPTANIQSTNWIAESFCTAHAETQPQLGLCYLPHLDYDLQRFGPDGEHLARNLAELDTAVGKILDYATAQNLKVLIVSEYGIERVDTAIFLNKHLRKHNLLSVTHNATGELLDPGTSTAFAVCDHQIAHIYTTDTERTLACLKNHPGIDRLYVGNERAEIGLNHERSGEIIAIAKQGCWFAYDYWLEDTEKPDFAHLVEIHKKPGYDPRELFFDPKGGKKRAAIALLRKKLGLRYRMNAISLDPSLVQGSHGRPPAHPNDGPILIGSQAEWATTDQTWDMRDIPSLIQKICEQ